MKKFQGIFPALVTPFHENGRINGDMVQRIVDANLQKGVQGFYIGGSTGESYLLTMEERKYMLEAAMEAVDGRGKVIANIGVFATEHGLTLAEHAKKLGVDAISSVPPFYFKFNLEEYVNYYNTIADAVDMPMILYNIPAMSGVHLGMEQIGQLFENQRIAGIKHTSYDLFQMQRIISEYPKKTVFIGHDEIFLSAFAAGAGAAIGSTFNFMAEKFIKIARLQQQARMEEALQVQDAANGVIQVLCKVGVFKGIKGALKLQGYDCGECRQPFLPLTEEENRELARALEQGGCI